MFESKGEQHGPVGESPTHPRWSNRSHSAGQRVLPTIGAAVVLLGSIDIADAQTAPRMPCHNASAIAEQLHSKYGEAPVAFGLQANGNLLQVYSSEERGTWTVVSTTPTGMTCLVASGKRWESLPLPNKDPLA